MTITYPLLPRRKQMTLRDMPHFQECLSEQVSFWLEDLLVQADDADDDAWNQRVETLLRDWRAGQGAFSAEVGQHIEAICDAVKGALK